MGPAYRYDSAFFDFVDVSSGRSAARFIERLELGFLPRTLLDVGCGRGVWLRAWKQRGVALVVGVDGAYVDRPTLHVRPEEFVPADVSLSFDLGRRFDLVECLEVAEHLPESAADALVSNLVRHGDVILFSAAQPGQGGEHHVNEQPLPYWIRKFRERGYVAFDHPRAAVRAVEGVEPWYRYNAMLFASEAGAARLSSVARARLLPADAAPPDYAPLAWKVRCGVLRRLPRRAIHVLAQVKHRLARTARAS
jgi:SAM-dependent methyltransferase